jgi:hypothetical protein
MCAQVFAKDLALVVLDPLGKVGGGKRYVPEQLAHKFPCMLEPFAAVARQYPGYPTIFRLPLRRVGSAFGKRWSVHAVKALLDRFLDEQATELLLFAKSVGQVTFAVRAENGTAQPLRQLNRTRMAHDAAEVEDAPAPRKSPRHATKQTSPSGCRAAPEQVVLTLTLSLSLTLTLITLPLPLPLYPYPYPYP